MRRYLVLALIAFALGALVLAGARAWHPSAPSEASRVEEPAVSLVLVIGEAGLEPSTMAVPKDCRIALTVRNSRHVPAGITLQGYQDRLKIGIIPPDSVWRGSFVADRPGDDFAWMVEGEPLGRLAVQGSHLIEGHR